MTRFDSPFGAPPRETLGYESRVDSTTVAQFFNTVYAWMAVGLALTACVAFYVSTQPAMMRQIFSGPALIILFVAEIGLVITISAAVQKINATAATVLFLIYSALNGLTLSVIFLVYTRGSLAGTFIVTAGTFGAMSVYGFTTKRDLTSMGSLL